MCDGKDFTHYVRTKHYVLRFTHYVPHSWDLIIIGGGITGAGILREAARAGLRVLLLEQKDFAWGTSSRSSKLVHGGLRYLKEGQIGLTYASVKERQQLLNEAPGLVEPLGFLLAAYRSDKHGRWLYRAGLTVYDLLALQWSHRYYDPRAFRMLAPHLAAEGLKGAFATATPRPTTPGWSCASLKRRWQMARLLITTRPFPTCAATKQAG
jgi:glycerol-3-phosphate dehydrogenase